MNTPFALALILAYLVFVAKTNARPNRSTSSLLTEEHVGARSDFTETAHTFGSGPASRNSYQTIPRSLVWDIIDTNAEAQSDDDNDEGSRPISLKPMKQKISSGVRAPPVEHGSIQSEASTTTQNHKLTVGQSTPTADKPNKCKAAILNCCRFSEPDRKNCFTKLNCTKTYATRKACLPEVIDMIVKDFVNAFSPR